MLLLRQKAKIHYCSVCGQLDVRSLLCLHLFDKNYNKTVILVKVTWHTTKYGDPYSEFVLSI